jgi:hypothetical protein
MFTAISANNNQAVSGEFMEQVKIRNSEVLRNDGRYPEAIAALVKEKEHVSYVELQRFLGESFDVYGVVLVISRR